MSGVFVSLSSRKNFKAYSSITKRVQIEGTKRERDEEYLNSVLERDYQGLKTGDEVSIGQERIAHFIRHG